MKLTEDGLKEVFRAQTGRQEGQVECPSQEVLRKAAAKELNLRQRRQVAFHLTACSECAQDYQIVHSVRAWARESDLAAGLPADGRVFIQPQPRINSLPEIGSAGLLHKRSYPVYLPYALVASVVAIIAVSTWFILLHRADGRDLARLNVQLAERDQAIAGLKQSLEDARKSSASDLDTQPTAKKLGNGDEPRTDSLEQALAEISRPQFNVPIIDLDSVGTRGGRAGSVTTIDVPRTTNLFTLILHTSANQPDAAYLLEILGPGGKSVWRGRGLKNTSDSGLTVALSRRLMPAGKYSIRLYASDGPPTDPIDQYVVEVRYH